jgi:WD40 repeat protein
VSEFSLPDALAKRIRDLAQSEKIAVEELLTIMVDRYTVASRLKTAEKPLSLSTSEGEDVEDVPPPLPPFEAHPSGTLQPITTENVDQIVELGALNFPGRITGMGYSPDGKYLAIRLEQKLVLWDMHTSQQYAEFDHDAWIETFAFTPDGKFLVVSSGNVFSKTATGSTIHYWNIETQQEEFSWKPQVGFANVIAVAPHNPLVVALISSERSFIEERPNSISISNVGVELWDSGSIITRFTDFRQFYQEGYNRLNDRVLAFGHDGATLYVCLNSGRFGQILAWEGLWRGKLNAISEPNECFMGLKLDHQGNNLAISNAPEGKLTVRNLASNAIIYANEDKNQLPYWLEFDATGNILIVGRHTRHREASRIDFVNLQTGETIREITDVHFSHLAFSPDNTSFAIQTNEIVLWGIPS